MTRRKLKRVAKWLLLFNVLMMVCFGVCWYYFPFPVENLEGMANSIELRDCNGRLLFEHVGSDDQWRRPVELAEMSAWLIKATVASEDERFYVHGGVDPVAIVRAVGQNIRQLRIVSGASTLDMQLCKMVEPKRRNLKTKICEAFRALQLNQLYSKDEIMKFYLNAAPYGGNVRGVQAAARFYFDKMAIDLSLAEAAMLAGLPQSPTNYRPDRFIEKANKRKEYVLNRMHERGMIDGQQLKEALIQHIDIRSFKRVGAASHAAWYALSQRSSGGTISIDLDVQRRVEVLAKNHRRNLPNGAELAVVVIDIDSSKIVAMVGSGDIADPVDGQVNGALAKRSSGSTLKSFVYAAAFEAGRLNCDSVVYDVPISRGGWEPENFDHKYRGEVSVRQALRDSLNVPAILVANEIGLARSVGMMRAAGLKLPGDIEATGGLSVVVGGAEISLLELTNAYAALGRGGIYRAVTIFDDYQTDSRVFISKEVCYELDRILGSHVQRPRGMGKLAFDDVPWFMWKTGTSSGRRDGWAVGHNGKYAVGVWTGRFKGTGRYGFVGSVSAEPILAEIFDIEQLRQPMRGFDGPMLVVDKPLPKPAELGDRLRILSPGDSDQFVCVGGETILHCRANKMEDLQWFLNGQLLNTCQVESMRLMSGRYELCCVDSEGQVDRVDFMVWQ
ncbi:MAG: penicillin-binding protein 1C [Phycisphaerae bacterium]|nr:penicillin-binding protein 1C [Phycisphaerae bacterium]